MQSLPRDQLPALGTLGQFLFMRPLLGRLAQPAFFRWVFAAGLRLMAALLAVGGLVAWLNAWRLISSLQGAGILGGFAFQLVFAVAIYMMVHDLVIRAGDVARLADADVVALPLCSILLRAAGELYAITFGLIGIGGCIGVWLAGYPLLGVIMGLPLPPGMQELLGLSRGGETFVVGLTLLTMSAIGGFLTLALFYAVAELIVVLVDLGRDTKATRDILERNSRA